MFRLLCAGPCACGTGEPFLPVEPIDAVDAGGLALFPQQDEQPPVPEPAALIGQLA